MDRQTISKKDQDHQSKRNKKSIDANPVVDSIIERLSIEYSVPKSQIWNLFAAISISQYHKRRINIRPRLRQSNSPAFQHNLYMEDIISELTKIERD